MRSTFRSLIATLLLLVGGSSVVCAQSYKSVKAEKPDNLYWYARISESTRLPEGFVMLDEKDPQTALSGMEYLLTLENDKSQASFCGATHMGTNSPDVPCTVEVAALFYVSYLFYQRGWDHFANGIALVNEDGETNTPETISKAYKYYRAWFKKVKEVGLDEARVRGIDPLKGTDIWWY